MSTPVPQTLRTISAEATATVPAWGKYESPSCYHRLEHHCADVAACFEALLREPVLRSRFAQAAGENLSAVAEARMAVIASLHDFGKLNAGFQLEVRERHALPPDPLPKMGHIGESFQRVRQTAICQASGFPEIASNWGEGVDALLRAATIRRPLERGRTAGDMASIRRLRPAGIRAAATQGSRASGEWR